MNCFCYPKRDEFIKAYRQTMPPSQTYVAEKTSGFLADALADTGIFGRC